MPQSWARMMPHLLRREAAVLMKTLPLLVGRATAAAAAAGRARCPSAGAGAAATLPVPGGCTGAARAMRTCPRGTSSSGHGVGQRDQQPRWRRPKQQPRPGGSSPGLAAAPTPARVRCAALRTSSSGGCRAPPAGGAHARTWPAAGQSDEPPQRLIGTSADGVGSGPCTKEGSAGRPTWPRRARQ
jgi:hypothetical protein